MHYEQRKMQHELRMKQLDNEITPTNRARLQAFLTLMAERPMGEEKGV